MSVLTAEDRAVVRSAIRRARGVLTERVGDRRDYETPRVDKPAQVGTSRSVSTFTGVCVYCGAPTLRQTTCVGHSDLPALDGAHAAVVTRNTSGTGRSSLDGSSAAGARTDDRT